MRLDQYLSKAMGISRSQSRKLIASGQVTVDGQPCKAADFQLGENPQVTAQGKALGVKEFVYIMLHKPQGIVSASRDKRDKTVVDLVAKDFPRRELFPAGRLDKTSTGFVLLTDDGALAHRLLAPKRHVTKEYLVELDTPLTPEMIQGFEEGVTLADGQTMQPAQVSNPDPSRPCLVRVLLHQGVYHQIKRMFGVYGAGVNALHRTAIGGVTLDPALEPGQWRELTREELAELQQE